MYFIWHKYLLDCRRNFRLSFFLSARVPCIRAYRQVFLYYPRTSVLLFIILPSFVYYMLLNSANFCYLLHCWIKEQTYVEVHLYSHICVWKFDINRITKSRLLTDPRSFLAVICATDDKINLILSTAAHSVRYNILTNDTILYTRIDLTQNISAWKKK